MAKHEFEGPIKGWVVNQMCRDFWRVEATLTREDVMQDAYETFLRCNRKTRGQKLNERQFMAYYKLAWVNQMNEMANADTKHRRPLSIQARDEDGTPLLGDLVGELENAGFLRVMMRQAPTEVSLCVNLLLNAPSELLEMALASWRDQGRKEAGGNKQVAAWLGLDANARPLDAVREYFSN